MNEREDDRTLAELAGEALAVQDACNLVGVARSYGRTMARLLRLCGQELGTQRINTHPIAQVWADKIAQLAGIQGPSTEACHAAYLEVYRLCLPGTGGSMALRLAAAEVAAAAEQVSP